MPGLADERLPTGEAAEVAATAVRGGLERLGWGLRAVRRLGEGESRPPPPSSSQSPYSSLLLLSVVVAVLSRPSSSTRLLCALLLGFIHESPDSARCRILDVGAAPLAFVGDRNGIGPKPEASPCGGCSSKVSLLPPPTPLRLSCCLAAVIAVAAAAAGGVKDPAPCFPSSSFPAPLTPPVRPSSSARGGVDAVRCGSAVARWSLPLPWPCCLFQDSSRRAMNGLAPLRGR